MAGKVRVKQPEPPIFPQRHRGSRPLLGNALAAHVKWNGGQPIGHKGKPIKLRVQMKQVMMFGADFD